MTFVPQAAQGWLEEHEYFSLLKPGRKWEGLAAQLQGQEDGGPQRWEGSPGVAEAATGERDGGKLSPQTGARRTENSRGKAEIGDRWGSVLVRR